MATKISTALVFAAALGAAIGSTPVAQAQMGGEQLVTNGPQASPGDNGSNWSARQNVIESQRYDRMLESSRGFRQARMQKECGPITDPQLHASCLASFNQDEPYTGSSTPPHGDRYRNNSGR